MAFTTAEKLQVAMLCDLAKPAKDRELDFDFIWNAVTNDDEWALAWKYTGLNLQVESPPEVRTVGDILEMWDRLEVGYEKLNDAEKEVFKEKSFESIPPSFEGFDGNNESGRMHIARLLVKDLDRWSRFKDRGLNSHSRTVDVDDRMLTVWRPLWAEKIHQGAYGRSGYDLSADEIAAVMRERIHPEYREMQPDGSWTLNREKLSRR